MARKQPNKEELSQSVVISCPNLFAEILTTGTVEYSYLHLSFYWFFLKILSPLFHQICLIDYYQVTVRPSAITLCINTDHMTSSITIKRKLSL